MNLSERSCCPVCESVNRNVIYSIPYASPELQQYLHSFYGPAGYPEPEKLKPFDFVLAECDECHLVYQVFIPDGPSLTTLYTKWISQDKVYELYEKRRELPLLENYFLIVKNLIQHIGHRDFKLFDYGFGYCHFLKQAMLFGIDAYGFEFNREQIALARTYGVKILENFNVDDAGKMDVIFCEQVLEHTTHPREIMTNLAALARKGTILHLGVPNSYNVKEVIRNIDWKNMKGNMASVNNFAPLEHINSFCESQLVRLASDFGFRRISLPEKYRVSLKPEYEAATTKGYLGSASLLTRFWLKNLAGYKPSGPGETNLYFVFD